MTDSATNPPPVIPTGRELFDVIMGNIEPELTSEGVKTLMTKYVKETPDEAASRHQRYRLAAERYKQAYEEYMSVLQSQVDRYRRQSYERVELEDRDREGGVLGGLLDTILQPA